MDDMQAHQEAGADLRKHNKLKLFFDD